MNAEALWAKFCAASQMDPETPYEAWAFGSAPDELADLVLRGIKTGTASAAILYELEQSPLPRAGEYSVILDSHDNALCVIRDTKVYTVPYHSVSEHHAWAEGEGDRSLGYWRQVHEAFFRQELAAVNLEFTPDMGVVCEEFEVLFTAG